MTIIKYLFLVGAISIGCHAEPGNHNIATDTIHIIGTRKDQLLSSQKANSNAISEEAIQRAIISKGDSSFHVYSDIRADYRIVGYESADTNSRKMIYFLFSPMMWKVIQIDARSVLITILPAI